MSRKDSHSSVETGSAEVHQAWWTASYRRSFFRSIGAWEQLTLCPSPGPGQEILGNPKSLSGNHAQPTGSTNWFSVGFEPSGESLHHSFGCCCEAGRWLAPDRLMLQIPANSFGKGWGMMIWVYVHYLLNYCYRGTAACHSNQRLIVGLASEFKPCRPCTHSALTKRFTLSQLWRKDLDCRALIYSLLQNFLFASLVQSPQNLNFL